MAFGDVPNIRPLNEVEHHFLQVLLDRFRLTRTNRGARLEVAFDVRTPTIWLRQAKHDLRIRMPDFERKSAEYQAALDAFLLRGEGDAYEFHDPDFPFRYVSGGTLPIVSFGGRRFVCLWYREVAPIGWNIANGGSGSRADLLDPRRAVQRELSEELIVVDPRARIWHLTEATAALSADDSELARALHLWRQRRADLDIMQFDRRPLTVRWFDAPDALTVHFAGEQRTSFTGCFLNINGEDYGIEIDQIAEIDLPDGAVLCDGEITHDRLVNAPVALFDLERFVESLRGATREFRPDLLFFDSVRHEGSELDRVIDQGFYPGVAPILRPEDVRAFATATEAGLRYDLCPVTRRIAIRYVDSQMPRDGAA